MIDFAVNKPKTLEECRSRLFYNIPMLLVLVSSIVSLSGCQYYADPIRQHNLCRNLSQHYIFQQTSSTTSSPPQYQLCGDNCYPCRAYTEWGTPPKFLDHPTYHYRYSAHRRKNKVLKKSHLYKKDKANNVNNHTAENINHIFVSSGDFLSPPKSFN